MFRRQPIAPAPGLPVTELTALIRALVADERGWLPRLRVPQDTDRWWTRLPSDPGVDVWLMSWLPGASTDLHDHGPSAAAFGVVRGRLTEMRQNRDGLLHEVHRDAGR